MMPTLVLGLIAAVFAGMAVREGILIARQDRVDRAADELIRAIMALDNAGLLDDDWEVSGL